jgi:mono/diheme cytochrome c family protein
MSTRPPLPRAPRRLRWLAGLAGLMLVLAALVAWLNLRGEAPLDDAAPVATPERLARGAVLAQAGNCIGCHTAAGGAPLAGGRGVETPFGVVHAPNITPDADTGIGRWSAAEFRRALKNGRARDGRLLYPAFPYPSYTLVSRDDADALWLWLRSQPGVRQANRAHALRFPYDTQVALALWRAMFFAPDDFVPEPARSDAWNRGRYLVQGLGHCAACHSGRNWLGGMRLNAEFAGGLMPDRAWYAPSLANPHEAGVQHWSRQQVVALLRDGIVPGASVAGPMAEVVYASTRHLPEAELDAMAQYLSGIAERGTAPAPAPTAPQAQLDRGAALYREHCIACHGGDGRGVAGIAPPLAGNRAVTMAVPNNVVQVLRWGGFPPATAGNPRPFGMPPFGQVLGDEDIAAVATHIRQSWGNAAPAVTPLAVLQVR